MSSQVVYIRYFDDCLVTSKTENENEVIFQKLNSLHKKTIFHYRIGREQLSAVF